MKTAALFFAILVSSVTAHAQPATEIRAANERLSAGDLDGAITILSDFTTKQPARGGALLLLARTYAQKGDNANALRTKAGDAFGSAVAGTTRSKQPVLLVSAPAGGPRRTGRV